MSNSWSAISGTYDSPDTENQSPSGSRVTSEVKKRRLSGNILQEINSSSYRLRERSRPRLDAAISVFAEESENLTDTGMASPPAQVPSLQKRAVKTRHQKTVHKRRSVSGEASKYIEHLEAELAATQSQLSSIMSPTVTREQTSKMRTLNAETRQLQQELAEWEQKYHERVQEEVDCRTALESGLRSRIRVLEQDAEETLLKLRELEYQLETTTQTLAAVETANIGLEKRLEMMSEILATSPTKFDLHAEAPGRVRKRHIRPKSMLPRFPTAGSLMTSPERYPVTQPTSPILAFTKPNHGGLPESQSQPQLTIDTNLSQSECSRTEDLIFSKAPITGETTTAARHSHSHSFSFDIPHFELPGSQVSVPPSAGRRPVRRMRRFGAGSIGPKPLILPSTSQCGPMPASAPPFERHETPPSFPFPFPNQIEDEEDPSPVYGRRRASTYADEATLAKLTASPFVHAAPQEVTGEDSMLSVVSPNSAMSQVTTRNFSSYGSVVGRNLFDELSRVRSAQTGSGTDGTDIKDIGASHSCSSRPPTSHFPEGSEDKIIVNQQPRLVSSESFVSSTMKTETPAQPSKSPSLTGRMIQWSPMLDRILDIFASHWRARMASARHLMLTTSSKLYIPEPLRNVQWWLVGLLLGPMARQRMMTRSMHHDCEEETRQLLDDPSPGMTEEGLAYGTVYATPPASPVSSNVHRRRRQCQYHRCKHSPWLWLQFSLTLAFAIGAAFKEGPGALLKGTACSCQRVYCSRNKTPRSVSVGTPC